MSEMKEKLHTGELYLPNDASIMKEQMAYQDKLCEYNQTKPSEQECLEAVGRAYISKRLFILISADITVILEKWYMPIIS